MEGVGRERVQRLRHPRVSSLVLLAVLVPTLATLGLLSDAVAGRWSYRSEAQSVSRAVGSLAGVARARALLLTWSVPSEAITYSAMLGIPASVLDSLFRTDFPAEVAPATRAVARDPVLASTPSMRVDLARMQTIEPGIVDGRTSNSAVQDLYRSYSNATVSLWRHDMAVLLDAVDTWQPPGSFDVHVNSMERTFETYIYSLDVVDYANLVLNGEATPAQKEHLVSAYNAEEEMLGNVAPGGFYSARSALASDLGPRALARWTAIEHSPGIRSFLASTTTAYRIALHGGPPPFATNLLAYAVDFRNGLDYVAQMNQLVLAASADLIASTAHQESLATGTLRGEVIFMVLLGGIVMAGALALSRALTRPVRRLGEAANQVQSGTFTLQPLAESGPREIAVTAAAFNDMTGMLRSLEAKAVALAFEDLTNPVLHEPLPGRAGRALQETVERLTASTQERERHRRRLQRAATHDDLTGLYNRPAAMEMLDAEISEDLGTDRTPAVLFVDLDGLKTINDSFGHAVGDRAIREMANALRQATRQGDVVARLGGDEFIVVLRIREPSELETVAGRIEQVVANSSLALDDGTRISLSCSIGAALSSGTESADELVRRADQAMYAVKRANRAM